MKIDEIRGKTDDELEYELAHPARRSCSTCASSPPPQSLQSPARIEVRGARSRAS